MRSFNGNIDGICSYKGEGLEIIKLDTYQGNVSINGKVHSLTYMDGLNKKKR